MATPQLMPEEQPRPVSAVPADAPTPPEPPDVGGLIQGFNAENLQHEDLWTRILHAGDMARHADEDADQAEARKKETRLTYLAVLAENPERHAPRSRQLTIAGVTLALDAVACNFAAQALGDGELETLAWTALFLAVLACGELALDFYRDRRRKVWRVFAYGMAGFVAGLGVLRYTYLITVGATDPLAAVVGAVLFTVATAMFVLAGYWALRRAETPAAGRARREARRAMKEAQAAKDRAARCRRQRDKLIDAYLVRIKAGLLQGCPAGRLPRIEAALRAHLRGQEPV
jgi:uncharacterized membrane protein YedE/YeeE